MSGFAEHSLDETAFGPPKGLSVVKAFDAFPKTKPSYQTRTPSGGVWTVVLAVLSLLLGVSELSRWWVGTTTHSFSVEKGISHDLQINLDMVVAMKCDDLRVNIQDAAGDRIMAGETLTKDPTAWRQWSGAHVLAHNLLGSRSTKYQEEDVHDYLGSARKRRSFAKTPSLSHGDQADACRIYGSLEGNKVQGDFHITARGHGYLDFGQHLDHNTFNFSHQINELSFGPFYPSLTNPLDNTLATTDVHYYKHQYFLSVVPTIYTTDATQLARIEASLATSPSSGDRASTTRALLASLPNTVFTNQYAVTEQSHAIPEQQVPGVFIRFDIEPILLTIAEQRTGFLALVVRLVNVVSGILVAGGWSFKISDWGREVCCAAYGRRSKRADSTMGFLHGRKGSDDIKGHHH